jgi:hypothetical protein
MANLKILFTSGSLVASGACTGALTGVVITSLAWELVSVDAIDISPYFKLKIELN